MVKLRRLDRPGVRAYLDELRPRFLVLRVRAKGVSFRWAVPNWAIEEVVRFALRLAPLAVQAAPHLPDSIGRPLRRFSAAAERRRTLALVDAFFSEEHRDLFTLPPGVPLVSVETEDVTFEITQSALGVRS